VAGPLACHNDDPDAGAFEYADWFKGRSLPQVFLAMANLVK
jgi:hypothetical protein